MDFWWWFTANVVILLGLVFYFDRNFLLLIINNFKNKFVIKIVIGFASAAILYLIFFTGDLISRWIFAFAQDEIFDNRKQTDLGKAERAFRIACSV